MPSLPQASNEDVHQALFDFHRALYDEALPCLRAVEMSLRTVEVYNHGDGRPIALGYIKQVAHLRELAEEIGSKASELRTEIIRANGCHLDHSKGA